MLSLQTTSGFVISELVPSSCIIGNRCRRRPAQLLLQLWPNEEQRNQLQQLFCLHTKMYNFCVKLIQTYGYAYACNLASTTPPRSPLGSIRQDSKLDHEMAEVSQALAMVPIFVRDSAVIAALARNEMDDCSPSRPLPGGVVRIALPNGALNNPVDGWIDGITGPLTSTRIPAGISRNCIWLEFNPLTAAYHLHMLWV